jgi:hypothetical protein
MELIRDYWRALVNTVMYLQVPYKNEKLWSSSSTGCFSRGLSSMETVS